MASGNLSKDVEDAVPRLGHWDVQAASFPLDGDEFLDLAVLQFAQFSK